MSLTEIEREIIFATYNAYFEGAPSASLREVRERTNTEETLFSRIVRKLQDEELIKPHALGMHFKITPKGVLFCENNKIASPESIDENQRARTQMLGHLALVYEDDAKDNRVYYEQLATGLQISAKVVRTNLLLLRDLDYIDATGGGLFQITKRGMQSVSDWRRKVNIVTEFERISQLKPQPRGRALQKLFAQIAEMNGWEQEEGARTSHEEIDVMIHREDSYYLIECKWERAAIEAAVVRELHGKLSNRTAVRGIIVSMSGFSAGAEQQAKDFSGQSAILFYGFEDVKGIVNQKTDFNEILRTKLRELTIRRNVIYN